MIFLLARKVHRINILEREYHKTKQIAMVIFIRNPRIYTVDILYYPRKSLILQELIWQTEDIAPKYPRIRRYLNHWYHHIHAIISEINIVETKSGFRISKDDFNL